MPSNTTFVWLPRVIFESALITVSILLALGLDEWREDRQDQETVEIALSNFIMELRQNKARVDDAAPFNRGLRDVLAQRYRDGNISSTKEFIDIVESYNPIVLQSTAWETALATGSVTIMEYNLVSALSLTYGLQGRYQQMTRNGLTELMRPQNLSPEQLELAVYNSVRYHEQRNLRGSLHLEFARLSSAPVMPTDSRSVMRNDSKQAAATPASGVSGNSPMPAQDAEIGLGLRANAIIVRFVRPEYLAAFGSDDHCG
jgi:hypothetical protein